jgi:putative FmdB family regulatory protein
LCGESIVDSEFRVQLEAAEGHDIATRKTAFYNRDMPIYEFECKKCKAHIEVFQKVSDKPPTRCRTCGGKLERKISAPAIQFKGTGWYVTDYAGKTTKSDKSESESVPEAKAEKTEKPDKKAKEGSPAKKASEKTSSPKVSSGD